MEKDTYKTIVRPAEASLRERASRFLAYAWPVGNEEEINGYLDALRKEYYDATHHCYAWRLGSEGEQYRANDDGEPSSTAGRPILGQMLSNELTDILIVVVRYYGGTKLGVPGLISAYREAAKAVIEESRVITKTVDVYFTVTFEYLSMNDVMRTIKEMEPRVLHQHFDNMCEIQLAIRKSQAEELKGRFETFPDVKVEQTDVR